MTPAARATHAPDCLVPCPIRVDYLGVSLLTLWAYLRRSRESRSLSQVFRGKQLSARDCHRLEKEILGSLNVSSTEAQLFYRALECSAAVFGHDRLTLSHAISRQLGKSVAGWRLDEEWEMIRAAKVFLAQLEEHGLTSKDQPIRTINVCHCLFSLARLVQLGRRRRKKSYLLRFLYSDQETAWLLRMLKLGSSRRNRKKLKDWYHDNNSFGRLSLVMLKWLRAMVCDAELSLVLTSIYRKSPAAIAAQRRLRDSNVGDSLLLREPDIDTAVDSDETKVDPHRRADGPVPELPLRPPTSAEQKASSEDLSDDPSTVADQALRDLDPWDPWRDFSPEDEKEETPSGNDRRWRQEFFHSVRNRKARQRGRGWRRLIPRFGRRRPKKD